ncbi:UNVERIFIED_CONTAM: hypothetical protein GTU68_010537 [Idotea baltica]|nr:hypothetical protein [Idotea baltica]
MDSGYYILGPNCEHLEREFADFIGTPYCVSVANGTDAVSLALLALDITEGDEVITSAHTANATVSAIQAIGAVPVLADIEEDSPCVASSSVERLITPNTKALVVVHMYGQPANIAELAELSVRYNLKLVEDCAQAHGAMIDGKKVGSFADVAAFSFYPTKLLGALGDGGAVVCKDTATAEKLRMLRQYGWKEKFNSEIYGRNSRLDELQAAILLCKLPHLDVWHERRLAIAASYAAACDDVSVLSPKAPSTAKHAYHLYVVQCDRRDELRVHLAERGVGTALHYPVAIHQQPAYRGKIKIDGSLVFTERFYDRMLSIPMYAELEDQQVSTISSAIQDFVA